MIMLFSIYSMLIVIAIRDSLFELGSVHSSHGSCMSAHWFRVMLLVTYYPLKVTAIRQAEYAGWAL